MCLLLLFWNLKRAVNNLCGTERRQYCSGNLSGGGENVKCAAFRFSVSSDLLNFQILLTTDVRKEREKEQSRARSVPTEVPTTLAVTRPPAGGTPPRLRDPPHPPGPSGKPYADPPRPGELGGLTPIRPSSPEVPCMHATPCLEHRPSSLWTSSGLGRHPRTAVASPQGSSLFNGKHFY